MSDEEIEFLGTKPAVPPTLQRPATGIILHVEKNGSVQPYRLTFTRSSTSIVHVGRRPGSESEGQMQNIDSDRAMFRCAVVSRKHAKLAFSDSGQVYLIDLSSHHGTHLRRTSESMSTPLPAEVPTALSDGDIITFGKTVGRHDECVEPIVVRVELLRNPLPIKPLVVPTTPSDKSTSGSSRSSSGRYGVYTSSSSDEHSSSPCYDIDSDIEEVQPSFQPGFMSLSSCGKAFDVLKSLVPPSHTPKVNTTTVPTTGPSDVPLSSTLAPITSKSDPSPPVLPSLQDAISFGTDACEALDKASRSSSPMDLESPATSPRRQNISLPSWPSERSSPEVCSDEEDQEESPYGSDASDSSSSSADENEMEEVEEGPIPVSPPATGVETGPAVSVPSPSSQPDLQEVKSSMAQIQTQVVKLDGYRRKYRTRFNHNVHRVSEKLSHIDDRLGEVNAQHDTLVDRVDSISRIELADVSCQLEEMNEQMETLAYVDVPDLQSQMDEMERDLSELKAKQAASEIEEEVERSKMSEEKKRVVEEAEKELAELKQLIEQMRQMKEKTLEEMKDGLGSVKEVCETTVADLKVQHEQAREAIARLAIEETTATPLKRKRDDVDDYESSYKELYEGVSQLQPPFCLDGRGNVSFLAGAETIGDCGNDLLEVAPHPLDFNDEERPRKRRRGLRRVASVVAHTAGAVTIGAVAAWTVLAFA